MNVTTDDLIQCLRTEPRNTGIGEMVHAIEGASSVDLSRDSDLLSGVWELRWSSARQPWLKQSTWLENLQVLDPANGRGMNLLRLAGPLGALAAVTVEAELSIDGPSRVGVRFRRGGWSGPTLPGGTRLQLMKSVNQSFPAWLEITALTTTLRICRGNAGTTFALLRRDDLALKDLLPASVMS